MAEKQKSEKSASQCKESSSKSNKKQDVPVKSLTKDEAIEALQNADFVEDVKYYLKNRSEKPNLKKGDQENMYKFDNGQDHYYFVFVHPETKRVFRGLALINNNTRKHSIANQNNQVSVYKNIFNIEYSFSPAKDKEAVECNNFINSGEPHFMFTNDLYAFVISKKPSNRKQKSDQTADADKAKSKSNKKDKDNSSSSTKTKPESSSKKTKTVTESKKTSDKNSKNSSSKKTTKNNLVCEKDDHNDDDDDDVMMTDEELQNDADYLDQSLEMLKNGMVNEDDDMLFDSEDEHEDDDSSSSSSSSSSEDEHIRYRNPKPVSNKKVKEPPVVAQEDSDSEPDEPITVKKDVKTNGKANCTNAASTETNTNKTNNKRKRATVGNPSSSKPTKKSKKENNVEEGGSESLNNTNYDIKMIKNDLINDVQKGIVGALTFNTIEELVTEPNCKADTFAGFILKLCVSKDVSGRDNLIDQLKNQDLVFKDDIDIMFEKVSGGSNEFSIENSMQGIIAYLTCTILNQVENGLRYRLENKRNQMFKQMTDAANDTVNRYEETIEKLKIIFQEDQVKHIKQMKETKESLISNLKIQKENYMKIIDDKNEKLHKFISAVGVTEEDLEKMEDDNKDEQSISLALEKITKWKEQEDIKLAEEERKRQEASKKSNARPVKGKLTF